MNDKHTTEHRRIFGHFLPENSGREGKNSGREKREKEEEMRKKKGGGDGT